MHKITRFLFLVLSLGVLFVSSVSLSRAQFTFGCNPLGTNLQGIRQTSCPANTVTCGNLCCNNQNSCDALLRAQQSQPQQAGSSGNVAKISDLETIFGKVVSMALSGAGIAALVMLVVGGFKFLSAGGDKEGTQKAGKTITYAIGGLVLVVSAWLILNLLGKFLGVDFSLFSITAPTP